MRLARPVLAAIVALQLTACGSSPQQDERAVATPTPSDADLEQLPPVPEAAATSRPPSTDGGAGRDRFLVAVFDDAQALCAARPARSVRSRGATAPLSNASSG